MPLKKIKFRPGIHREASQHSEGPTYWDCDKIRFKNGRPQQIGGENTYRSGVLGICRSLYDWGTSLGDFYMGVGTTKKFYVDDESTLNDYTPIRETTAAGDVTFAIVADMDATLTVSDMAHGAVVGDFVTYSGAISLGGNITAAVLNHEYEIATVTDANTYTIEAETAGGTPVLADSGTDTGNGGPSVVGAYQINTGGKNYAPDQGYGNRNAANGNPLFSFQLRLWSQDNFGDDLIFCGRGGGIWYWDSSTTNRAIALSDLGSASDAPTHALQVMVSSTDRHVICFGVNPIGSSVIDPLLVRWSDQEDAGNWTPTATNTSGGQVLPTGTEIVGAVKTKQEILIFTDTSVHSMRFTGSTFVFQMVPVIENISLISPNAAVSTGDTVFFMSREGFHIYDGSVRPLKCDVQDYIFRAIESISQYYKFYGYHNAEYSEVTWFYTRTSNEITNYVTYNYLDGLWTIGTYNRTAWIPALSKTNQIAAFETTPGDGTQILCQQETGRADVNGQNILSFIETGGFSSEDGEWFMFMDRYLPDFTFPFIGSGDVDDAAFTILIQGRDHPLDSFATLSSDAVTGTTKQVHVRCRAREMSVKISADSGTGGFGWGMGDFTFDLRTDGRR